MKEVQVRHSRVGFTIIEMLIVLVIASLVLVVLGTVLASSFRVLRKGESRAQMQSNARNVLNYLVDNVQSANTIPRALDRDLDFVEDADLDEFGIDARYVVGEPKPGEEWIHLFPAGTYISEAFSDRIITKHKDEMTVGLFGRVSNVKLVQPSLFEFNGLRVSSMTSIFRLAIPVRDYPNDLPGTFRSIYYLSDVSHNRQYTAPDANLPENYSAANRTETCIFYQSVFLELKEYTQDDPANPNVGVSGDPTVRTAEFEFPIASNITRVKYEYFHKVPIWVPDPDDPDTAYLEDTNDDGDEDSPVLSGWKLVQIDVMDDSQTYWNFDDIYRDESVSESARVDAFNNWNIDVFYNEPPDRPTDAPMDWYGWLSNGEYVSFEFDLEDIIGIDNGESLEPNTSTDFGNGDGIPDGDGVPDDPVPAWWLPYLKAIRITVISTPTSVIEERRNASGVRRDHDGNLLYYNLDSPIPYSNTGRTIALTNAKDLFIGNGKDVVVSQMVYPELSYNLDVAIFPLDNRVGFMRRADYNTIVGMFASFDQSTSPIDTGGPIDASDRYWELYNYLN